VSASGASADFVFMDLPSTTSTRAAPANGATATAARRSTTRNTQARAIATLLLPFALAVQWLLYCYVLRLRLR
jgi:hypothetical protein